MIRQETGTLRNVGRSGWTGNAGGLEAASGFEPENRGFADLRLNHLATPPANLDYKRVGTADQPELTGAAALNRISKVGRGGNSSVVECDLAKVEVAGSNPVSRSNFLSPARGRGCVDTPRNSPIGAVAKW